MPTYFSVFARSQNEYQLKSFSDLKGMRVGFEGAARPTRSLLETYPEIIKKPYDSHEAMTQALLAKEVDVLVAWMSYDHWRKDKLQGTIDNVLLIDEYPIEMVTHIRKDWPELIPIFNRAIKSLQQEELPRIINRWFGQWPQASTASSVPLTPEDQAWFKAYPDLAPMAFRIRERVQFNAEEREWLQTKTKIPVRVGDYPPFFFIADGRPQGVSIDYVQLICMAHNLDCDYKQGLTIADSIPMMKRPGGIAIQPGWQKSAEREKVALFTGPYVDSPFVIFQREGSERVRSMEDLVGKRVVVEKNYAIHQLLKIHFPDLQLVEVDFSTEAIERLAEGKVDAYVSSLMAGYYLTLAHGYPNIVVSAPAPFEPNRLEIAVRSDWPELASIITKSIAAIRPEEHQNIRKRWLSINYQEKIDYILLWQVLSAVGFVLFAVIYWNQQLSRKVAARTSELSQSEERFRSTFEQAAVGIAHISMEGRFLRINKKFCKIVGYSVEEMLAKSFQDITHPDDLGNDLVLFQQVLDGVRANYSLDKRYIHKKGEVIWINLTTGLLRDEAGNPTYFVSVVKDISLRKQAELKLIGYQNRLKALRSQLSNAEDVERTRIAAELHDSIGQTLALCRIQLARSKKLSESEKLTAILDEISASMIEVIQQTQGLVFDLRSPLLYELGLDVAIADWLERRLKRKHGINFDFNRDDNIPAIKDYVASLLFRNFKELMTNSIKHGMASKISVILENKGKDLLLVVEDDGIGFDPEIVTNNEMKDGGFGLFSIIERMSDIDGSLSIISAEGQGCIAILKVPIA